MNPLSETKANLVFGKIEGEKNPIWYINNYSHHLITFRDRSEKKEIEKSTGKEWHAKTVLGTKKLNLLVWCHPKSSHNWSAKSSPPHLRKLLNVWIQFPFSFPFYFCIRLPTSIFKFTIMVLFIFKMLILDHFVRMRKKNQNKY